MDKFLKGQTNIFEEEIKNKLELDYNGNGYDNSDSDDGFFIIKMLSDVKETYRAPFCALGDKILYFYGEFPLQECLQITFKYFNKCLRILDRGLYLQTKKQLKKDNNELILPRKDHHHLINSKVQYLKILQEKGFISSDSQILFPIDSDGEWIDFTKKKHFDELKTYLDQLDTTDCSNYPLKTMKNKKSAFKNKRCVLKLPYAGSSDCVLYPENITYDQERGNYLFWLAVYLKTLGINHNENPLNFNCLGFTQGIIIDRYNPYISTIGEFRTFISNGDAIAMSYSSDLTVDGMASIKPLFLKSSIKDKNDPDGFFIYEKTLEIFKKSIMGSASVRKYWDNSLSDKENFLKLVMEKISKMSKEINSLLNLDLNRFDFVLNHNIIEGNPFNLMINEIEDIVFGDASINQFAYQDSVYMKYEQYKYLKQVYPEKYGSLTENQDKFVIKIFTETDPFEAMNVESLIESYQNALSSGNLTSDRRRLRSSKRSRSSKKSRSSRSSSEEYF